MKILRTEHKMCMCCMETHDVHDVVVKEKNIFKGNEIEYDAVYEYCDHTSEFSADEDMITSNDISMKNAYRRKMGLLTVEEIMDIRNQYSITQKDLACVLGWGEKTITRYEGHQVQDMAHDAVIRKINDDPEWFLELLEKGRDKIASQAYDKYKYEISKKYEIMQDMYLRKSILARYVSYQKKEEYYGNTKLNFDKIVDVINYFAKSIKIYNLYKVKLMKLLWYADSLSYKRYGHSMTGMIYFAKPMGALPLEHKKIVELKGIQYEEIEFEDGSGMRFMENADYSYKTLTKEDQAVLDTIIEHFGSSDTKQIVEQMHDEEAYKKTSLGNVIDYRYAQNLHID